MIMCSDVEMEMNEDRVFSYLIAVLLLPVFLFAGCGGDDTGLDAGCEDHDQCLRSEACIESVCVDAPEQGDPCPEAHEGDEFEGLQCQDGTWQSTAVVDATLTVSTQPPQEIVAGQSFEVAFALVDDEGQALQLEGVEIEIDLQTGEFAPGTDLTSTTTPEGVAEFAPVIEQASTSLEISAHIDDQDLGTLSVLTDPFTVVASDADAAHSTIYGTDGVTADGDEIAEITIELFDEFSNPVAGVIPQFIASGGGNSYEPCSETDHAGVSTCGMTSTEAGEKTLQITDPVEVSGESIEFLLTCIEDEQTPFGGGAGTEEDPYRLCTPEHLNGIGETPAAWDRTFVVLNDIDMLLVESFPIIGDDDTPFSGHLDGRGFPIRNLSIDRGDDDFVGFFGVLGEGAVVEYVVLDNVDVIGSRQVGGLVGENRDGTVRESATSGRVEGTGTFAIGGLVGRNFSYIDDSSSTADVFGAQDSQGIGGLVGVNGATIGTNSGTISGSHATGAVSGANDLVGGLAG